MTTKLHKPIKVTKSALEKDLAGTINMAFAQVDTRFDAVMDGISKTCNEVDKLTLQLGSHKNALAKTNARMTRLEEAQHERVEHRNLVVDGSSVTLTTTGPATSLTMYRAPLDQTMPFDYNPTAVERVTNAEAPIDFDSDDRLERSIKDIVAALIVFWLVF